MEQSITTFLRLYKSAPISRFKSNVVPFIPFETMLERTRTALMFRVYEEWDVETATIIYGATTGVPHGPYMHLWVVHKQGGRRDLLHMSHNRLFDDGLGLSDLKISQDGKRLSFLRSKRAGEVPVRYVVDIASTEMRPESNP